MTTAPILLRLSDTNLTVADPAEDVRGFHALDADGQDIGKIEDLLIDDSEKKIRFLLIGSGGFLGLGEKQFLVPIDAITKITNDKVRIDRTREHVASGPAYEPKLVDESQRQDLYSSVYGYYGLMPYWGFGYAYPAYPFYL